MNTIAARILVGAAGAATITGLALGGVATANAATPTSSSTSTTKPAGTGVPFQAVSGHSIRAQFGTLPTALKTDLKALHGKKGIDRKTGRASIEAKALSGTYGADVKTAATDAKTMWAAAPASFKTALKSTRHASKTDRAKDYAAIETKALSGSYGTAVQMYANTVQSNVQKQQSNNLDHIAGTIL